MQTVSQFSTFVGIASADGRPELKSFGSGDVEQ
jgi:hypothetical protein